MGETTTAKQGKPRSVTVTLRGKLCRVHFHKRARLSIESCGMSQEQVARQIESQIKGQTHSVAQPQSSSFVPLPDKRLVRHRFLTNVGNPTQLVSIHTESGEEFSVVYSINLVPAGIKKVVSPDKLIRAMKLKVFVNDFVSRNPKGSVQHSQSGDSRTRFKAKLAEHIEYLERVVSLADNPVPESVARRGLRIWKKCAIRTSTGVFLPSAGATDEGRLIYTWDAAGIHLEAEIPNDQPTEWYYQNDSTQEIWYEYTNEIPDRVMQAIREIEGTAR